MKSRGFTLIELMIVIALIGLLAAIAVPQIQKISRARDTATQSLATGNLTSKNTTEVTSGSQSPWEVSKFDKDAKIKRITRRLCVLEYEGAQYIVDDVNGGIVKHR